MRKLLALILFFNIVLVVRSQSIIAGLVSDKEDGSPLVGAALTVHDSEDDVIAYAISKRDGSFVVKTNSALNSFVFKARLLGYRDVILKLENISQDIDIKMDFGEIQLREVVVKSQPIWNRSDTLVYSVEAFKNLGDKTIGDILKRLPGVEVSESGGIRYQGESINKFYIEGLDLLENRYGIATNNVPVDAVRNVEILENHQYVEALKGALGSDKAAINLRLKDDKMARPVGTISLGAGYADDLLWLAEAFALSAGQKQQSIVMYKANNSAKNISSELRGQSMSSNDLEDVSGFSQKRLFDAGSLNSPPLDRKRYLFNNSHVVSINNLWRTGNHSQVRLNVQYVNDNQKASVARHSEYFMQNGTLRISESDGMSQHSNNIESALTFTNNSPKYYLNNYLRWSGDWGNATSSVIANAMGVNQKFDLSSQIIKNDLQFVKKSGNRVWDITSFAVYSSQPQFLEISVDTTDVAQTQSINLSGFYTRNSTYYNLGIGSSRFIIKGVLEASLDNYRSNLNHPILRDSVRSNVKSDYLLVELVPSYIYRKDKITINADVFLKSHYFNVNNHETLNQKYRKSYLLANPSVRMVLRLTPMLTIRASYRYSQQLGDFMNLTDTYVMSSYRTLSKYNDVIPFSKRGAVSGGFQYRNPITTFFANTSLTYAPTINNTVSTQRFIDYESISGKKEINTHSKMIIWNGYMGKYLASIRTNVALSVGYNSTIQERQQQGVLYPLSAQAWRFMPKVSVKISDVMSVSYQVVANNISNKITVSNDNQFKSSLWHVAQQVSAYYKLGHKWQFNSLFEHSYNEIGENTDVKMFFGDIGVSYKHRSMELDVSLNNIFNNHKYSYSLYNGLDRFDYVYDLRPRMLMLTMSYRY